MTFAQRRNHLTTHFSERIPVVKRHMTVHTTRISKRLDSDVIHYRKNRTE